MRGAYWSVLFFFGALASANAQTASTNDDLKERRDQQGQGSSQPVGERSVGVRARSKPGAGATSPDNSYQTIDSQPPSRNPNGESPAPTSPTNPDRHPSVDTSLGAPLPESLRIQQEADRANPQGPDLITPGGSSSRNPTQENVRSEQNRLDPSAPSRDRLQIDDLSSQQPKAVGNAGMTTGASDAESGTAGNGARAVAPARSTAASSRSSSHGSR